MNQPRHIASLLVDWLVGNLLNLNEASGPDGLLPCRPRIDSIPSSIEAGF
jgi:hypothetical protein